MDNNKNNSSGLMKSILAAHLVLILHIALIAGIGCLILFFRGIVQYMAWILVIGSALIFFIGWMIRRRMVQEGKQLKEMLSLPAFSGRTIEVSVLGGMASIRLESPNESQLPNRPELPGQQPQLIGAEKTGQLRELSELVELLNKNLITLEEYNQFKARIMNS